MSTDFSKYFYYDESSPTCLRWKITIHSGKNSNQVNVSPGDVAGCTTRKRKHHFVVTLNGKQELIHRIVYSLFNELDETGLVDHKDGNGYNNRIGNLRSSTHTVNMRNCKKRSDNKTGMTGVNRRISRHGTVQYSSQWRTLDGKQKSKTFSGENAFELACKYREKMIAELNVQGAGYTERHGT
jgi:hypothetical protein